MFPKKISLVVVSMFVIASALHAQNENPPGQVCHAGGGGSGGSGGSGGHGEGGEGGHGGNINPGEEKGGDDKNKHKDASESGIAPKKKGSDADQSIEAGKK